MAGIVPLKRTAIDTGAYSVKTISDDAEGSFMSIAAQVGLNALDGFGAFKMTLPNSYRLEIISTNSEGRFDYNQRQAWVVGEAAAYEKNPMYSQRDMQRFNSELYMPFIAGALRTSFPIANHTLDEVKRDGWLINKKWATPIHIIASIAPGYYRLSQKIIDTLQDKYIAFVDSATKGVYVFRIELCTVVPESFGSFQYMLYDVPPKGSQGQAVRHKQAEIIERATVAMFDFGGQTLDYMVWKNREILPNGFGTTQIGFNSYVDTIAEQVFNKEENIGLFSEHLTRHDILLAMRGNYGKRMFVTARGGKKVEITEDVTSQMNLFATNSEAVWRDRLRSGQGIQILGLGGGAALDAYPYINGKLEHEKRVFVSRNRVPYEMYMANAIGALLHERNKDAKR